MPEPKSPFKRVRRAFEQDALKRICEMRETDFAAAYDMSVTRVTRDKWWDSDYQPFHAYLDRGSRILAVAHLDTVVDHRHRTARFLDTHAGPVVHSGALDDRLGAYTILELLPQLGVNVDVLLTVGEETGQTTAEEFVAAKEYNWMIEFDRGGTDVVMYQYEDAESKELVRECGARVGDGIFSDIGALEHLEIKGFNWGVGYQDYHSTRGYAYLEDYWTMVGHYLKFHAANAETYLPHEDRSWDMRRGNRGSLSWLDGDYEYERWLQGLSHDDDIEDEDEVLDVEVDEDDLVSEDFTTVNEHLVYGGEATG